MIEVGERTRKDQLTGKRNRCCDRPCPLASQNGLCEGSVYPRFNYTFSGNLGTSPYLIVAAFLSKVKNGIPRSQNYTLRTLNALCVMRPVDL